MEEGVNCVKDVDEEIEYAVRVHVQPNRSCCMQSLSGCGQYSSTLGIVPANAGEFTEVRMDMLSIVCRSQNAVYESKCDSITILGDFQNRGSLIWNTPFVWCLIKTLDDH